MTFSNVISGQGYVSFQGSGQVTLTAVSTYSGETYIDQGAGALVLSGSGSIASSGQLHILSGASFEISSTTAGTSIMSLNGVGGVSLGAKTLTITAADYDVFEGIIAGTGGVIVSGGVQTFSGANTYSGGTVLKGGVFDLEHAVTTSSGDGGTGTILSGPAGTSSIAFTAGAQTLQVDRAALGSDPAHTLAYALNGFAADGDVVELCGVQSTDTVSYDRATGLLTVLNGSTVEATLKMPAGLTTAFSVAPDPDQGGGALGVSHTTTGVVISLASVAAPSVVAETASVAAGATVSKTGGVGGTGALAGAAAAGGATLSITSITGAGAAQAVTAGSTSASNAASVTGTYGTLTIGADGSYSYAASNGLAIVTAASGSPLIDTFSSVVSATGGATSQASLAVTVSLGTGGSESITNLNGSTTYSIGATTLKVNGIGLPDTIFSGIIQDGASGNTGGSFVKTGSSSTLYLTGANTYTGATTIDNGGLVLATAERRGRSEPAR